MWHFGQRVLTAFFFAIVMAAGPVSAWAGPPDEPVAPPVKITPGGGGFLGAPERKATVTLTLDRAAGNGDLEPNQVEQAKATAASAQGITAGAGASGSTVEGVGGSSSSAGAGSSEAADPGECAFRAAAVPAGDDRWGGNDPAAGTLLVNLCNGPQRYLYVPNAAPGAPDVAAPPPPPPPDPAVLAEQAYGELSLPGPAVQRSPDANNFDPAYGSPYTWVGLHTWVWVNNWQPLQRTVDLRGVSATVTATPTALVFDPGNGDAPVTCDGPGRPWTAADGNEPPTGGGCAYVYRSVTPDGPLTATTGITWSVVWTSNTGAGGAFPALTTAATSSFLVEQIQVVVKR